MVGERDTAPYKRLWALVVKQALTDLISGINEMVHGTVRAADKMISGSFNCNSAFGFIFDDDYAISDKLSVPDMLSWVGDVRTIRTGIKNRCKEKLCDKGYVTLERALQRLKESKR